MYYISGAIVIHFPQVAVDRVEENTNEISSAGLGRVESLRLLIRA